MIRWPLLIIGIMIIIFAQIMEFRHKPLPDVAEKITLDQALEYVNSPDNRFVEIEAVADTTKVIYGTVVKKPSYTLKRTDRDYDLEEILAGDENPADYVGTVIHAGKVLSGDSLLLQTVADDYDKKELLRERVFAHVTDRIWILSPLFQKGNLYARENWLAKSSYEGGMIYFKDIKETVQDPKIENDLAEMVAFAEKEFGIAIPDDALTIIDGYGIGFIPKAYYPLKGSDYSIFLVADSGSFPENLETIRGILRSAPASAYSGFTSLLGVTPGERIGTVVQESAVDFNRRKEGDVKETFAVGVVFVIFASIGFLRKRLKKKKTV